MIIALVGNGRRLPYAALSFAAVVAFIPGVFLFRIMAGLVHVAQLGDKAPPTLVPMVAGDGVTAVLILVAMGCGLIAPKLVAQIEGERKCSGIPPRLPVPPPITSFHSDSLPCLFSHA